MTAVLVCAAVAVGGLVGRGVDVLALRTPRRSAGGPELPPAGDRAIGSPWAELIGGVTAGGVALRFGWSAQLPAWSWFVAVVLLLAFVDLRTRLLPNRVLLPSTAGGVLLLAGAAALDDGWPELGRAVLGGGAAFGVLLVLALVAPSGMGMGDVKLAGLLGLYLGWLGWPVLVAGLFLGFVVQAVVGLALIAVRRAGRTTELPFGPALVAGALAAALLS